MSNARIKDGWDSYQEMVVPIDAPDVQIAETKQAFYSGAAILFHTIMLGLEGGDEATDADMQWMQDLQNEIDAFGQQLDCKILGFTQH